MYCICLGAKVCGIKKQTSAGHVSHVNLINILLHKRDMGDITDSKILNHKLAKQDI